MFDDNRWSDKSKSLLLYLSCLQNLNKKWLKYDAKN